MSDIKNVKKRKTILQLIWSEKNGTNHWLFCTLTKQCDSQVNYFLLMVWASCLLYQNTFKSFRAETSYVSKLWFATITSPLFLLPHYKQFDQCPKMNWKLKRKIWRKSFEILHFKFYIDKGKLSCGPHGDHLKKSRTTCEIF